MGDRMSHQKRAEVGDLGPTAVIVKAYHFIGDGRHTVRAASSGEHGIKGVSDEGDICDATNETPKRRTRLAGRKRVTYRRRDTVDDPGDTRVGIAPCVRPNRANHRNGVPYSRV